MPRARINTPEEEEVVRKPRTRKPRVVSDDSEPVPRPRKRVVTESRVSSDSSEIPRKAPTQISSVKRKRTRNNRALLIVTVICILISGTGIVLGMTDKGVINVVAVVNDRNEKINRGEVRDAQTGQVMTQTVPVQDGEQRPNGGMRLAEQQPGQTTPPPVTDTLASTTTPETISTTTDTTSGSTTIDKPAN